jgi:aconitate decarboxylase
LVLELTGKKYPKDGLEAKFSVYHGAACGLLYGRATPAEYTDEVVQETADLRSKITATVDKSIRADECKIVAETRSGKVKKHVEHAVGSLARPLSDAQLQTKFVEQVEPILGKDEASKLFTQLMNVLEAQNVGKVIHGQR